MPYHVEKSEDEWREELTPEEYAVLRKAGTERPFVGEYTDTETTGIYRCKACQAKLFESDTKFHSGCGWPSFYQPISDTIEYIEDNSHGMKRTEVRCASCGYHLGHGRGHPLGDRRALRHVAQPVPLAEPVDRLVEEPDGTAAERVQPHHRLDEGGLARTVGSEQGDHLAGVHGQVDAAHDRSSAQGDRGSRDLDHCRCGAHEQPPAFCSAARFSRIRPR